MFNFLKRPSSGTLGMPLKLKIQQECQCSHASSINIMRVLAVVLAGRRFLTPSSAELVKIHRPWNLIYTGLNGTLSAVSGTNYIGGTLECTLSSPASSLLYASGQYWRAIVTEIQLAARGQELTTFPTLFRGAPGSQEGVQLPTPSQCSDDRLFMPIAYDPADSAASPVAMLGQLHPAYATKCSPMLYLGRNSADEKIYMANLTATDITTTAAMRVVMRGLGLEFLDAGFATEFDRFMQTIGINTTMVVDLENAILNNELSL